MPFLMVFSDRFIIWFQSKSRENQFSLDSLFCVGFLSNIYNFTEILFAVKIGFGRCVLNV